MSKVCGVDLGFSGALSVIDENGVLSLEEMPTIQTVVSGKNRKAYDVGALIKFFSSLDGGTIVFIEKVSPVMAKFGASSGAANFHLGYGLGAVQAILETLKIRYELVTPITWQKHFQVNKPRGAKDWDTKGAAYTQARALFPNAELTTQRGRVLDGRSDALLIAEYGRRKYGGTLDGNM